MLVHWIWLATRTVSDRVKVRLLEHFRDPEDIYFADSGSFSQVEGMTPETAGILAEKDLTAAEDILRRCSREKISILLSKIQSTLPSREGFYILPYYFRIVNEIMPSIRKKSLFLEVSKSPF